MFICMVGARREHPCLFQPEEERLSETGCPFQSDTTRQPNNWVVSCLDLSRWQSQAFRHNKRIFSFLIQDQFQDPHQHGEIVFVCVCVLLKFSRPKNYMLFVYSGQFHLSALALQYMPRLVVEASLVASYHIGEETIPELR